MIMKIMKIIMKENENNDNNVKWNEMKIIIK